MPRTFTDRLLHLHYSSYGNYSFVKKCFDYDQSLETIYLLTPNQIKDLFPKNTNRALNIFRQMKDIHVDYLKHEFNEQKIDYLHVFDPHYPTLLKEIYDPPWLLYFRGDLNILNQPQRLSVVGTRHPSENAKKEMSSILSPILKKSYTVVSGMALGIDALAHELALEKRGKTIAVLGFGLNQVYPERLRNLKETLETQQLVMTEYPPYVRPQRWQFPERNRIISGLSHATFIIEAKEKSGSLITADCALEQNREVFALPGRISQLESAGTNRLIQQGAKMILKSDDIIVEYE
ncbi:DNA-protecting protein DprA [Salipaludibacillus keqinensis]|uniref:DNA-protecting protein DprA n=1 Tax=Salipaludibacillus keqinensis TaxID=2045207 RepID=A0A323TIW7_9BACI|nr:DNA-protecting protein DprA [Salipaludibacillus keqinensis]